MPWLKKTKMILTEQPILESGQGMYTKNNSK